MRSFCTVIMAMVTPWNLAGLMTEALLTACTQSPKKVSFVTSTGLMRRPVQASQAQKCIPILTEAVHSAR